jgi:alkyl sulfatase BDS1-like metallo-beta-lactamase superfamily hydrolase
MQYRAIKALLALACTCGIVSGVFAQEAGQNAAADASKHFDPKGKPPSKFTIELQKGVRATLPFDDKRDFEEAKKGFIAAPEYKQAGKFTDSRLETMQELRRQTTQKRDYCPDR